MLKRFPIRHDHGFTLVEMMVVIAVLAILIRVAMPSFTQMLRNYQIRNAAGAILNGVQRARAEAIARNASVRFCMGDVTKSTWDVDLQTVACSTTISATALDSRVYTDGSKDVTMVVKSGTTTVSSGAVGITYNNLGQMITNSGGLGTFDYIEFDAPALSGSSQKRRVLVGVGGNVRSCDPAIAYSVNARGC